MSDPTTTKKRVANAKMRALKAAKKLPRAILVQKKVECDAKALKIVERMIEPQITEEWLLQNLAKINRSHLEDIIEERAMTRLCGYVLCDNPLTKVVNKKYEISTLRNKVYDVQKTKNFCSFWCYSASEYLLEQMLTSPLWIRADEEIPVFMTFKKPRETMENHPGVEINIVGIELPVDVDPEEKGAKENEADSSKSNEKTETQVSNNTNNDDDDKNVSLDDSKGQVPVDKLTKMEETKESDTMIENSEESNKNKHLDESCNKFDENVQKTDNNSQQMEKMEASRNTEKHEKRKQRSPVSFESLTARVEKSMEEWITKTTVDLIQGDDITKQSILNNVNIHEKYEVLCKKLNTIQLEEGKEERINAIQTTKLEPLPHFSVLKEETEVLEHKVKAFFKGDTTIEIPDPQERIINENDAEMASETFIPLTEAHAPVALRRRIFLDKLNKVLPDLLTTLSAPGYYHYTYTPDKIAKVKALVGTFNLTAANIVFKSAEWTLVALLLMKMLSLMDDNVKELLVTTQATTYTTMILMSYQLDCNYLDRLVTTLMQKTF